MRKNLTIDAIYKDHEQLDKLAVKLYSQYEALQEEHQEQSEINHRLKDELYQLKIKLGQLENNSELFNLRMQSLALVNQFAKNQAEMVLGEELEFDNQVQRLSQRSSISLRKSKSGTFVQ